MKSIIELIENQDKTDVRVDGFSDVGRQTSPNLGKIVKSKSFDVGDTVLFYNNNLTPYKSYHLIDDSDVIVQNQTLLKEGAICLSQQVSQFGDLGNEIRKQNFFFVSKSTTQGIEAGMYVVVRPTACYRFNMNGLQWFFVDVHNITLKIDHNGISGGPRFKLLNKVDHDLFNVGEENGVNYIYTTAELKAIIKNTDKVLVNNKNIIGRLGRCLRIHHKDS